MKLEISSEKNNVLVQETWWQFSTPVLQACLINDVVVIIFDYMAYPKGRPISNLVAFDKNQTEIWKAEHPIATTPSCYTSFINETPLTVYNFAGFICRIDLATGKMTEALLAK